MSSEFARRVLAWFDDHGRKDLPWQRAASPYRVWVSEIMLQQTQVGTVIPYYERFMARFPDVRELAAAPADEVLHHWSGLGYYARARNLHRTARQVCEMLDGQFPDDLETMQSLPGIGRSTAAAILSLAKGRREVILDGNVKRVIARYFAIAGWPGTAAVSNRLWTLADSVTPPDRVAHYNQAIMDLGATVCTRSRPNCSACPLRRDCVAHRQGNPVAYPGRKPNKVLPQKTVRMLLVCDPEGSVLLERRPPTGVWGGLWCLPETAIDTDPLDWCFDQLSEAGVLGRRLPARRHTFSHFHLHIEPIEILLNRPGSAVMEAQTRLWYNSQTPNSVGLAAPVARLLAEVAG